MHTAMIRVWMLVAVSLAGFVSCDTQGPSSLRSFMQYVSDMESIGAAVAKSLGYPADRVEVSGNRAHLHISILDFKLVEADPATLKNVASQAAAAAEPILDAQCGVCVRQFDQRGHPPPQWV